MLFHMVNGLYLYLAISKLILGVIYAFVDLLTLTLGEMIESDNENRNKRCFKRKQNEFRIRDLIRILGYNKIGG